jgi:hypothetical protein
MAEAISQHKKMAMGESVPLASGKSVMPKYAKGGAVMSESRVAKLPAKGSAPPPLARPAAGMAGKIATLKGGGKVPAKKGIGLTIAVAVPMRKASGRGR